jgi:hypothetical protein
MNRSDMRKEVELSVGKASMKGPSSKREDADPVDPTSISESMEETGSSVKVRKGRPEPKGHEAQPHGSIVGSGSETEGRPRDGTVMNSGSGGKAPRPGGSIIGSGDGNGVPFKGPRSV